MKDRPPIPTPKPWNSPLINIREANDCVSLAAATIVAYARIVYLLADPSNGRSRYFKGFSMFCMFMPIGFIMFRSICEVAHFIYEATCPGIPGYCYLSLFKFGQRCKAIDTFGSWPTLKQLKGAAGLKSLPFRFFIRRENGSVTHGHVVVRSEKAKSFDNWLKECPDLKVGGETSGLAMPMFRFYVIIQPKIRMTLWILAGVHLFYNISDPIAISIFVLVAQLLRCGYDWIVMPLLCYYALNRLEVAGFVLAGYMFIFSLEKLMKFSIVSGFEKAWKMPEEPPNTNYYPQGLDNATNPNFNFQNLQRKNNIFTREPFVEDETLTANERRKLVGDTGLVVTSGITTGNSHAMAAQCTKYFKWMSAEDICINPKYIINVGGTFRGWPLSTSGVALQPAIEHADFSRLNDDMDESDLGRAVIDFKLKTTTRPVGSTGENFNPNFTIQNIGGADFYMVHCYDIPIKALLAAAYANNSKTCYVVMNTCPALFAIRKGSLTHAGQVWEHIENNKVRMSWKATTDRVWEHSYRYMYEHIFTEWVHVAQGVYYQSQLRKTVGDTLLIRWDRTANRPGHISERSITIQVPHDLTVIPAFVNKMDITEERMKFFEVTKQHEDFIHNSKSIVNAVSSLRALVDNYKRNRDFEMPHMSYVEVSQIYRAEKYVRYLAEYSNFIEENPTWREIFGFEHDKRHMSSLAIQILDLMKMQPPTTVTRKTIVQEEAYVMGINTLPEQIRRTFIYQFYGKPNQLSKYDLIMEGESPSHLVLLEVTKGRNLAEKFCNAMFSTSHNVRPILPLGLPHKGGSMLQRKGNLLLPTEVYYLMTYTQTVALVYFNNDTPPILFGSIEHENPFALVIDMRGNMHKLYVMHYPRNVKFIKTFKKKYNCVSGGTREYNAWINLCFHPNHGNRRAYGLHNGYQRAFVNRYVQEIHSRLDKCNNAEMRAELQEELEQPPQAPLLNVENAICMEEIATLDQRGIKYFKVYDRDIQMEDFLDLPPAHWYSQKTIQVMENMKYY